MVVAEFPGQAGGFPYALFEVMRFLKRIVAVEENEVRPMLLAALYGRYTYHFPTTLAMLAALALACPYLLGPKCPFRTQAIRWPS